MADGAGLDGSSALRALEADLQGELEASIADLRARLESAFSAAEERIGALEAEVSGMAETFLQQVGEITAQVNEAKSAVEADLAGLSQVEVSARTATEELDAEREARVEALEGIGAEADAAGGELEGAGDEAASALQDAVEQFVTAMADLSERAGDELTQASEAMGSLDDEGTSQIERMATSLSDLGEHASTTVEQANADADARAEQTAEQLIVVMTETANAIIAAAGLTGEAMGLFDEFSGAFEGDMGQRAEKVVNTVGEVVEVIERIEPVIELANQLV